MTLPLRIAGAWIVLACAAAAQNPATVKRSSGPVLKGAIVGIVVQGEAAPSKTGTGYGGLYYVAKGEQIEAIDEDGIHFRSGTRLRYVSIGQKKEINVTDVVRMAVDFDKDFMAGLEYSKKNDMAAVSADYMDTKAPTKLKLIGTYRRDGQADEIIPAVEIATTSGKITVPVADIVPFRPKG